MVNVKPTTLDMARAVTELQESMDELHRATRAYDDDLDPVQETAKVRVAEAAELVARNLAFHRERAGVIERGKFTTAHVRAVLSSLGADATTIKTHEGPIAALVRNNFG